MHAYSFRASMHSTHASGPRPPLQRATQRSTAQPQPTLAIEQLRRAHLQQPMRSDGGGGGKRHYLPMYLLGWRPSCVTPRPHGPLLALGARPSVRCIAGGTSRDSPIRFGAACMHACTLHRAASIGWSAVHACAVRACIHTHGGHANMTRACAAARGLLLPPRNAVTQAYLAADTIY